MGRGVSEAGGNDGGIASLALAIEEHGSAFEHDVMAATGRTLSEFVGQGPPGVVALAHFLAHIGPDSATWAEKAGVDDPAWASRFRANLIMADAMDALLHINRSVVQQRAKHKLKKPRPYPRPFAKEGQHIGKDAIPVRDFWSWWDGKAKE